MMHQSNVVETDNVAVNSVTSSVRHNDNDENGKNQQRVKFSNK